MANDATKDEELKLIPIDEVCRQLSISHAMVYRLIERKDFPRPVKIGKASRWAQGQINRWVELRLPEQSI